MRIVKQIHADMIAAMKAGDADRRAILRQLVSAFGYAEIDNKGELTDEAAIKVLGREAKKRREAIEIYAKGGRQELAAKEKSELEVIEGYLPAMMSEAEVRTIIERIVAREKPADFGLAMRAVMAELKGKADGALVSRVLREILG